MSKEIAVRTSLNVRKVSTNTAQTVLTDYRSNPTGFTANQTAVGGPSPGQFSAALAGTDCNFSNLSQPALLWMMNLDDTNTVVWGINDKVTGKFYPVGDLLPGEFYAFRVSQFFAQEEGTVAGTVNTGGDVSLRFKALVAPCKVRVDCFEK